MTRRTIKYRQAVATLKKLSLQSSFLPKLMSNEDLYAILADKGFVWDKNAQTFTTTGVRTSAFMTADGSPTNEYRIRLRAHASVANELLSVLEDLLPGCGFSITHVSNNEKDRSGASVRIYIQGKKRDRKLRTK